jgi:hypothetical protein
MLVRPPRSSKRTAPAFCTSASPTLRQAMRWLGRSSTISASHSTDLPSGPETFQWLVVGPVTVTSSTSGMKAGKLKKSRQ